MKYRTQKRFYADREGEDKKATVLVFRSRLAPCILQSTITCNPLTALAFVYCVYIISTNLITEVNKNGTV